MNDGNLRYSRLKAPNERKTDWEAKKNRNDVRVQSTQTHDNDVYVTLNNKLTTEFIWMYWPIWDTPYKCEK